jgi:Invasin, domain 3/Kelch motif
MRPKLTAVAWMAFAAAAMASCSGNGPTGPIPPSPLLTTSTIHTDVDTLIADGASTTTVTVVLRDSLGHAIGRPAGRVVIRATTGAIGAVFDHGDGTYSSTFTAPTRSGTATVEATLDGAQLLNHVNIELVGGPASPAHTLLSVSESKPFADGVRGTLVFVGARDANDNPTANVVGSVALATTVGLLGPVQASPVGIGTFVAMLTSEVKGIATVSARMNGISVASTVSVEFVGGFWKTIASLPGERQVLGAGAINGVLYAVGGGGWTVASYSSNLFAYVAAPGRWESRALMPTPRGELAVGVANGQLYAVGGYSSHGDLAAVEAYDPSTNSWSEKAAMPTPREGLAVGVVNGILYAIGGNARGPAASGATIGAGKRGTAFNLQGSENVLNTVEAYDPATDTWTTRAPMPTARSQLAVAVVNGILYAIGGQSAAAGFTTVEAYDPETNRWSRKRPLPEAYGRAALAAGQLNGLIYAVGGAYGYAETNLVDAYDPAADRWTAVQPLGTARQSLAVAVVNGRLYAVGGACYDDTLDAVEFFQP